MYLLLLECRDLGLRLKELLLTTHHADTQPSESKVQPAAHFPPWLTQADLQE